MKKLRLLFSLLLFPCFATYAQGSKAARPLRSGYFITVKRFRGNKLKPFLYHRNVHLLLRGQSVFPKDSSGLLVFSGIASTDTVDLIIKSGSRLITINKLAAWWFRDGASVAFGTIPKLWKLKSIAEQDEYTSADADYTTCSTRYRLAPQGTTIDLVNISQLGRLFYITCCSYGGMCLMKYQVTAR